MWKLLAWVGAAGLLALLLAPQWRSLDQMGETRFEALDHPRPEILVGVSWPFSTNGDGMAQGLALALGEINAEAMAAGTPPIRLILRDDRDSWDEARGIAMDFAATPGMSAVLGYHDDVVASRASAIFEQSRLLHLVLGATGSALTGHGYRYVVRTLPPANQVAAALASTPIAARGRRKFAIIWEESPFAKDLGYQYRIAMDALGGEVVYQWAFSREHVDFREPVNVMRGLDVDTIFFAGPDGAAGDFLRMARKAGLTALILGAFGDTPELRRRAGPALDGAVTTDFYDLASPHPKNRDFVRNFREHYAKDPDAWGAQGYDGLHLLAWAIRATGSSNPLDLAFTIRFMPAWDGANGRYKFDSQGELDRKRPGIRIFQGGKALSVEAIPPTPP